VLTYHRASKAVNDRDAAPLFQIRLEFHLGGIGQRENVHFSAFAMQPNRRLMKVNGAFIQMDKT